MEQINSLQRANQQHRNRQISRRIKRPPSQLHMTMRWRSTYLLWFWNFKFLRYIHWEERFGPGFILLTQPRCVVQEPNQVAVGIQVVFLRGLNQAVDHSAGLSAGRGVGKEPVLPARHKGLDAAPNSVDGELQSAVLQIGPLLPQIVQHLAQGGLGHRFGADLICPCQQSVQNRFLQFQPLGIAFFRHQFHERLLQPKQPGAITFASRPGSYLRATSRKSP